MLHTLDNCDRGWTWNTVLIELNTCLVTLQSMLLSRPVKLDQQMTSHGSQATLTGIIFQTERVVIW
jgi:hypothetical protein